MPPIDQLGAEAPEGDDLRATLVSAFRENVSDDTSGQISGSAPESVAPTLPVGETDAQRADRIRDEQGRFAKSAEGRKDGATAAVVDPAAAVHPKAAAAPVAAETPETAASVATGPARPPHGWSPAAKAAFDTLPAEVRDAVARREAEVNAGFAKLADYKGLEPFADMAKQSGTTLQTAFTAYQAAEDVLRNDFVGGVSQLCQTFGKHPVELAAGLLRVEPRALALALQGGRTASQGGQQQGAPSPQAPGVDPRLLEVIQRQEEAIRALSSAEEGRTFAAQKVAVAQTQSVIDAFFDDHSAHPYAHNLEGLIVKLVAEDPTSRQDLQGALNRAYETAVWMSPETRSLAIKAQVAPATAAVPPRATQQAEAAKRARGAARSLTGSPVAGADTAANAPAATLRDELRRAMAGSV